MKAGFQRAKNVKISSKGNWYVSIPFFHLEGILPGEIGKTITKRSS